MDTSAKQRITYGILFASLTVATLLALLAPEFLETTAGAWVVAISAIVFVATLLTLTAIASFGDNLEGNSFSELVRDSTVNTTFYPWALSVYMGRWFHPVDDLSMPLGVFGPILIMFTTFGVVVLGDMLRKRGKRIYPWLLVLLGFVTGSVAWPA